MRKTRRAARLVLLAGVLSALAGCAGGGKAGAGAQGAPSVAGGQGSPAKGEGGGSSAERREAPAPVGPVEGDVIGVVAAASKDLNTFNNQPHTVVLVLYQLSQSSVFSQLLETPEGKAKLLEGESFDGSVLSRRRIVVQPGETQQVVLDRMEGARYLGAVGGFYSAEARDMGRLVPVVAEKSGALFWKKPKPQIVGFDLGRSGFGP